MEKIYYDRHGISLRVGDRAGLAQRVAYIGGPLPEPLMGIVTKIDHKLVVESTDLRISMNDIEEGLLDIMSVPRIAELECPNCGETECISIQYKTKVASCGTCHSIWETSVMVMENEQNR